MEHCVNRGEGGENNICKNWSKGLLYNSNKATRPSECVVSLVGDGGDQPGGELIYLVIFIKTSPKKHQ